jgi:hypothetical protein
MTMVRAAEQPENRQREQCFFDAATVREWAAVAALFDNPCLLCAPTVGAECRDLRAATLDVDTRFAVVPGFRSWDLKSPAHLNDRFGVILCDPPFFSVSLGQLARAIDVLAQFDREQPIAVTYLKRREMRLLEALERFGVAPTGSRPGYKTVDNTGRNEIEVYANFAWPRPIVVQRSVR